VDATVTPQLLVKEFGEKKVTVSVTAKCSCGKGITGSLRLQVLASNNIFNQVISSQVPYYTDLGVESVELFFSLPVGQ
jgi:hypothetical protein